MKTIGCKFILVVIVGTVGGCWAVEKTATNGKPSKEIIVEGNNQFALSLYEKLRESEGNLFFSPYSISTALALTFAGARGRTESQMADVLQFPVGVDPDERSSVTVSDRQQFARLFGEIIAELNERGVIMGALQPATEALTHMPSVTCDVEQARQLSHGMPLAVGEQVTLPEREGLWAQALGPDGELIAVGTLLRNGDDVLFQPKRVLACGQRE